MENSFVFQKNKIPHNIQNNNQYELYDINNNSNIISHFETETGNNNLHSNESLSNIIDVISNNNLNLFYEDDSTNFKRNIDNLNLKFYLETEKILASTNYDSNNLFLILFKQITLYIKEIERLNVIILYLKQEAQKEKKSPTIQKKEIDYDTKKDIINALRFSNDNLEKKINNLIASENNLKQENLRLIQENQFYKNNNSSNTNINNISHTNEKGHSNHKYQKNKNKTDLYSNKKHIKNNPNYIVNTKKSNYYNNYKNDISISNNKAIKINKENNKLYKNNEIDSKSIIISVKRDEHLLLKGHRRNYSDQIGVGVLNQDNIILNINNNYNNYNNYNNSNNYNNGTKKIIKNNNTIKINKNNIISFGVSTPKAKPIQIKNNQLSGIKKPNNSKYKNSKSIKNDKNDKNDKKIFTKKKTDYITNKSKHIDFKVNSDKNTSLMKCSSLVFNKPSLYGQQYGNMLINITENNHDFLIDNEIEDLSMMENLLNQIKDYLKSNISSNNIYTHSTPNIKK